MNVATFVAAQLLRAFPRVQLSRVVGRLCEKPLHPLVSRAIERSYVRVLGVDMSDAATREGAYPSFDAFFTRPLRPGARHPESSLLISPADGRLDAVGPVSGTRNIRVKGQDYSVAELAGDPEAASRYAGGSFGVIYLSPRDYHRVHSPVAGHVARVRGLPGDAFPVNSIGEHVDNLFVRNGRVVIEIETETMGLVSVVMVGAMIVGRISVSVLAGDHVPPGVHPVTPPRAVVQGEEIGVFHLGSTVVLLLEPGRTISRSLGVVRCGQALAEP